MTDPEELPILPSTSNLAVVAWKTSDSLALYSAPRWLTSAVEAPHDFPLPIEKGHPLYPFAPLARELFKSRGVLRDYCLELEAANGDPLIVLVQGGYVEDVSQVVRDGREGEGVVLSLRDVSEVVRLRRQTAAIGAFHGIVGQSLPMLEVYHRIATYGPTEAPVIITGETGTGKELVARAMHERSRRADNSFVAVNCMALTVDLFESELFGHEKGSFTGAYRQHRGRFQRADGGTLFLDEIGDMPMMTQAKMLRALEEGVVEKVGAEKEERVDVRVIAATNVALEQAVQMRRFRPDLYHRLSVLRVHVPALRERHGDLPILVRHYLDIFNRRYEKDIKRVTPEALRLLEQYHWPGNVRELRNVIERLVIETQGDAIGSNALLGWMDEREYLRPGDWNADSYFMYRRPIIPEPSHSSYAGEEGAAPPEEQQDPPRQGEVFWGSRSPSSALPALPYHPQVVEASPIQPSRRPRAPEPAGETEAAELTPETIQDAYRRAKGNLTRAAALMGVHKATLYRHMKRLDISREDLEAGVAGGAEENNE